MTTAIITVTQGDFEYIDEWITYHHNIGVELFCIGYNGEYDDFDKLPKYNYVKYFDISTNNLEIFKEFNSLESKRGWPYMWGDIANIMFNYIKTFFSDYIKYIAIIDTDEFISPTENFTNITEYLDKVYNQNLVAEYILMQFYNGNNQIYYEDKPVLERFTTPVNKKNVLAEDINNYGYKKTIINLQHKDIDKLHIKNFHQTNLSDHKYNMEFNKIVLKHFYCKSLEEWIRKMSPKYDRDYFKRFKGSIFAAWQGYYFGYLNNYPSREALKAIPELLKKYGIDYKPEIEENDNKFIFKYKKINNIK